MLTISQLAALSGVSAYTLRFYERIGVLKPIQRTASGHRRFHPNDVDWLSFVIRLKTTGMSLAEIKRYAELRQRGDVSLALRLKMLEKHREYLADQIGELMHSAELLDKKIDHYKVLLAKNAVPKKMKGKK